jgi:hypothetical protein
MVRPKLEKLDACSVCHSVSHISRAILVANLVMASQLAFGADEPAAPTTPAASAAPEEKPHLQLSPIFFRYSVGGMLGYTYNRVTNGTVSTYEQKLGLGLNLGAQLRTFIWQPWFANVRGTLGSSLYSSRNAGNDIPVYNTTTAYNSGEVDLDVLQKSRFPFRANYFRKDNRQTALFGGTPYEMQNWGYTLIQAYTSQNRRLVSSANWGTSTITGLGISPSISRSGGVNADYQLTQYQSLTVAGSHISTTEQYIGQDLIFDAIGATHYYRPNNVFAIASNATATRSVSDVGMGTAAMEEADSRSRQFTSYASWRPEKSPLTVTASIRFMRYGSTFNGMNANPNVFFNSSNFNLGANYLFSPLIRLYGVVNVQDISGIQTTTVTGGVTAARRFFASTKVAGYRYSGAIGGGVTSQSTNVNGAQNQTQTNTQSQSLNLYLTHALDKGERIGHGTLTKNLNQTLSTNQTSNGYSMTRLTTNGTISLTNSLPNLSQTLSLMASDSRNVGGKLNVFQMVNLQASSTENLNTRESLYGNMTVQVINTEYAGTQTAVRVSPRASLGYHNLRAFNIRHLDFMSDLELADTNIHPSLLPGYQDMQTRTWDNNFKYAVGRLIVMLNTRVATIGGANTSYLQFSVTRMF